MFMWGLRVEAPGSRPLCGHGSSCDAGLLGGNGGGDPFLAVNRADPVG